MWTLSLPLQATQDVHCVNISSMDMSPCAPAALVPAVVVAITAPFPMSSFLFPGVSRRSRARARTLRGMNAPARMAPSTRNTRVAAERRETDGKRDDRQSEYPRQTDHKQNEEREDKEKTRCCQRASEGARALSLSLLRPPSLSPLPSVSIEILIL